MGKAGKIGSKFKKTAFVIEQVESRTLLSATLSVPGNSEIFSADADSAQFGGALPPEVGVTPGEVLTFSASGTIHFGTNNSNYFFDVEGNNSIYSDSMISSPTTGISGYTGPVAALLGVFAGATLPDTTPDTVDFNANAGYATLSPELGQIFYVGDGTVSTEAGGSKQITVPAGATQLFLGVADSAEMGTGAYAGNYPGDYADDYEAYTVNVDGEQSSGALPSQTSISASTNAITTGSSVSFAATVSGTGLTPTGVVSFLDNGTPIGSAELIGGVATFPTTTLPVGAQSITASYDGDTTYSDSVSAATVVNVSAQVVVALNATTSKLTASANIFEVGQSCQLTCTVSPVDGSTLAPTGTITIFEGGVTKDTETLGANGTVNVTWTANTAGPTSLDFVYNGDSTYATSTSAAISQTYLPLSQLTASIKGSQIPSAGIAGQPFKAKVPATFNNEGSILSGTYTTVLYADTSSNGLTGNQVALETVPKRETLKAKKGFAVTLTTKTLPQSLPAGTYYLLVE